MTQPTANMARASRTALICSAIAVGMVGLAYASVPLYRLFCQVTGFGGTTQRAEKPADVILDRTVFVRFDGTVAPALPWTFEPVERRIKIRIGETAVVTYRATNRSDRVTWGTAGFNVVPDQAGIYFNKLECFCFTEQKLEPGQTVDMPVSFFIDPRIVEDKDTRGIEEITLSYTFHVIAGRDAAKKGVAELPTGAKRE